ncbi:ribonuclease P protein component [Candidatus Uabimicrobium amorphum]|uniref:Ribonuclease P protein component n=1 Tax=Uabimicrobium amorphum TaxID=2596890 RepID=A0A5S9ITC3_UABAM|nr:ribonuclease P protein component [Candidatus Uabimicrobium amorphum]BBM87778.1 ribonuclease P protein component [Candidatus Uabimicrobium amorphum]
MVDKSFPQQSRLRAKSEFSAVFAAKKSHAARFLRCYYRKNSLSTARLGIVVSRKYGKAYERNRFKRIIRETFRLYKNRGVSMDIVVLPNRRNKSLKYEDLAKDMFKLLEKSYRQLGDKKS